MLVKERAPSEYGIQILLAHSLALYTYTHTHAYYYVQLLTHALTLDPWYNQIKGLLLAIPQSVPNLVPPRICSASGDFGPLYLCQH